MDWLQFWLREYYFQVILFPSLIGLFTLLAWFPGHNAFWHDHPRGGLIRAGGWILSAIAFSTIFLPIGGLLAAPLFVALYIALLIWSFGHERRRRMASRHVGFEVWQPTVASRALLDLAARETGSAVTVAA